MSRFTLRRVVVTFSIVSLLCALVVLGQANVSNATSTAGRITLDVTVSPTYWSWAGLWNSSTAQWDFFFGWFFGSYYVWFEGGGNCQWRTFWIFDLNNFVWDAFVDTRRCN